MISNNNIPQTTQSLDYTQDIENDSSGASGSFSGRSVTRQGVNFSYIPKQNGSCNLECVNITKFSDNKAAVTFYFGVKPLGVWFKDWSNITESYGTSYIQYHDVHHHPYIHKKVDPLERHTHVLIESDKLESYVQEVSEKIGLSSVDIKQIQHSTRYFCDNPGESGIDFQDGSYAENGGASELL
ncbi:hypothetical protein [Endozoicomonas sp. 8E]|uniref:hypothetical protein n=1 Tax=Endozoicomonas sp. 8E TaxID=3035692 RepID=UPI002938D81F|nr:hypothetical protein [Endozoicomonas sp. 8E]WOG27991.1 hypothetical protein P6910_26195 [Endozoicomonas sp. 8E]